MGVSKKNCQKTLSEEMSSKVPEPDLGTLDLYYVLHMCWIAPKSG